MADLKISQLTALSSAGIDATDQLPLADISASQTKKVTPLDLVNAGVRLMPSGAIPAAKVDWTGGITLSPGSVQTTHLADSAVTTIKIADGAVTAAKITGPIGLDKLGTAGAGLVLAGPTTGGATTPAFRSLVGSDLPIATATGLGAVKITAGGGLSIAADGAVGLTAVVGAGSGAFVTYNNYGQITASRALAAGDLPLATSSVVGVVKPGSGLSVSADGTLSTSLAAANLPLATSTTVGGVKPGAGLSVDVDGAIGITNSITPGTGVKVTYDAQGMITGVSALAATDVPDLDASKITTGAFGTSQIANRSVTQQKLADYAIAYIQEASPGSVTGTHPIGELWFQESTAKLAMWNGNSWMSVGQGALSDENMRFCGLFNAATGLVTALTPYGTTAGLTVGGSIPTATNQLTGVYLACDTAGTHDTKTYDVGDWIMCLGQARGWERLDLAAGGGGGGASKLSDLVDVTITTPASGDVLHFDGSTWVNGGIPDPGTY